MKEAQTLQEALNAALNDLQAWKAAALAAQSERDALAAQVEVLRIAALNAVQSMSGGKAKAYLRDAYDATPQQHLAEIKAQAGRAGWMACWNWVSSDSDMNVEQKTFEDFANEYAESILKGGSK